MRALGKALVPGVPEPPKAGWSMSMPVSMMPTLMPRPVRPSEFCATSAPVRPRAAPRSGAVSLALTTGRETISTG